MKKQTNKYNLNFELGCKTINGLVSALEFDSYKAAINSCLAHNGTLQCFGSNHPPNVI